MRSAPNTSVPEICEEVPKILRGEEEYAIKEQQTNKSSGPDGYIQKY